MNWIPVASAVAAVLAAGISLLGVMFAQQRQSLREMEAWRRKEVYETAIRLIELCNSALYSEDDAADPKRLFADLNSCYARLYGLVPGFGSLDGDRLLAQFKIGKRDRAAVLSEMQDVATTVVYGLVPPKLNGSRIR